MAIVASDLALLRIPQVAALATSAWPAWLWSADGSRVLWANAAGAAIFGMANAAEIHKSAFASHAPLAAQIVRLAATLPSSGQERLERLRGFGMGVGRVLTCACSRLTMADGKSTVLVAATEPAGPSLPLQERLRRLFAGAEPVAAFTPGGALLYADATAQRQLSGAATLSALGLETLAAKVVATGHASGTARLQHGDIEVTVTSLGQEASRVLMVALPGVLTTDEAARSDPEASGLTPSLAASADGAPPLQGASRPDSEPERRHPLRFVWHMDADGRFAVGSDEFIELVGPRTVAACGRLWSEIAAELKLDPDNEVAHAIATHETWSGISLSWPVDDASERLPVELSGLPVFDRNRAFCGYRGFGVCRDVERINQLARTRRSRPIGFAPSVQPLPDGRSELGSSAPQGRAPVAPSAIEAGPAVASVEAEFETPSSEVVPAGRTPAAANVVPFRAGTATEARAPSLSPVERSAFRELAQELTARLRGVKPEQAGAAAETASAIVQTAANIAAVAAASVMESKKVEPPAQADGGERMLLDRLPVGALVYRNDLLLYANRHFLELTGYASIEAFAACGGLNALFAEPGTDALAVDEETQKLSIVTRGGDTVAVEGRLFRLDWNGASGLALILASVQAEDRLGTAQFALHAAQDELRELKAELDRVAKREAQKAAAAKADFLAKISHEIRTPLNSIIGFAEVIMAERFGSIGNERYREYLRDMHAAGTHLLSLLNDLLDLSKIETGQLDLAFADVDLNELTQQCVDIMQPQANRARIIIRSALAPGLPLVTADARSLRQMVINLLANAIKFTGPGGQVIVSSAMADRGAPVLRVRDTGAGMREAEIETMLDPLHQTATSASWDSDGRGLALPLSKALAEANRAIFSIKSAPNAGTLIEIAFAASAAAQ